MMSGYDRQANILDPIQSHLPEIWESGDKPLLKPRYAAFIKQRIYETLERNGYSHPERWARLYVTGSLTTYQYSSHSDADVNLFVQSNKLPEWSRAEMIGIMTTQVDGTKLPGLPYALQVFVMPKDVKPADKYQSHIRSGYSLDDQKWVEPPDKTRVMDIEREENAWYVEGLEAADKMQALLRYEPIKAVHYLHQIHARRQRESEHGDFGLANIIYKFLDRRGLLDRVHALEKTASSHSSINDLMPEKENPWCIGKPVLAAYGLNKNELLPQQHDVLNAPILRDYDPKAKSLLKNPPSGLRIWRVEQVGSPLDHAELAQREEVGRHWTMRPQVINEFDMPKRKSVIWQATLDNKHQIWPRDHDMWQEDPTMANENEFRLRSQAPLDVEGYSHYDPDAVTSEAYGADFWPYADWDINDLEKATGNVTPPKGWKFQPTGKQMTVTHELGNYTTPYDWQTPEDVWDQKDYEDQYEQQKLRQENNADYWPEIGNYYTQLDHGNPWQIGQPVG